MNNQFQAAMRAVATATALLLFPAICSAQDFAPDSASGHTSLSRDERRLVGLVARVTFNEALDSEDDLAMIWETVRGSGDSAAQRYYWLRSHSPCVSGVLSQDDAYRRPGNCRWTRNLTPEGNRPRGWDRSMHGRWSWLRDRWVAHVARVVAYVSGRERRILCPVSPTSWDGARWRDEIVSRGFTILECKGDMRNLGVIRE